MVAATEVPLWGTLLIGLVGGVLGTLVGTALTISHERGAEFRTRMLTAADEFLQTAGISFRRATDLMTLLKRDDQPPRDQVDAAFQDLEELGWELLLKLTRITLLFDEGSLAVNSALDASSAVEEATKALRELQEGAPTAAEHLDSAYDKLTAAINRFGTDVRRDVRKVGWLRQT